MLLSLPWSFILVTCSFSGCRVLVLCMYVPPQKKGAKMWMKRWQHKKSTGVSGRGCMPLCRAFLNRPHLCALTGLSHKPSVAPACLPSTLRARLVTCFAGYWRLQRNPLWGKQRKRWKRVRCLFGSVLHFSLSIYHSFDRTLSFSLPGWGENCVW